MTPASAAAMAVLRQIARGHPGASSGERAAWDLLRNLRGGTPVDFIDCFVRLDGEGRAAVVRLLADVATGQTGVAELR